MHVNRRVRKTGDLNKRLVPCDPACTHNLLPFDLASHNSMEIGSAYAIQVCLLQIPAMIAFTAWYSVGRASMLHKAFT